MIEFDLLVTLIVVAGVIAVVMPTVGYLTLAERKVLYWGILYVERRVPGGIEAQPPAVLVPAALM